MTELAAPKSSGTPETDRWVLSLSPKKPENPVGISFYTLASLSYTFDVYLEKMKAVRNPIDYALFIAFFPHLIASPIIRARQFIIREFLLTTGTENWKSKFEMQWA